MLSDNNPPLTDNNLMFSSQFGSSIGDNSEFVKQKKPSSLALNLLNDEIPKIVDMMAQEVRAAFEEFLVSFSSLSPDDGITRLIYLEQIKALKGHDKTTLYIDITHIDMHDETLCTVIKDQFYRYILIRLDSTFNSFYSLFTELNLI